MNNNVIIEASLKNSNFATNEEYLAAEEFHTYNVNLAKPVTINAGDSILLNKAFIDTESEIDGVIRIDQNLTIYYDTFLYMTNDLKSSTTQGSARTKVIQYPDGNEVNDNFDYYIYNTISSTKVSDQNMEIVTGIDFDGPDNSAKIGDLSNDYKPTEQYYPVAFDYIAIDDKQHTVYIDIPLTEVNQLPDDEKKVRVLGLNIFAKRANNVATTTLVANNTNGNWDKNNALTKKATGSDDKGWHIFSRTEIGTTDNDHLAPIKFENNFTIDKGNYTPQQIVDLINNEMDLSHIDDFFTDGREFRTNSFMKNSSDYLLFELGGPPDYSPEPPKRGDGLLVSSAQKVDVNGNIAPRTLVPNQNIFIGTNQVEIAYDDSDNKFYWNYLHFPVYDSKTQEEITFIRNRTGTTEFFVDKKNGGAGFANLSAKYLDDNGIQQNYDFWEGKLGFNLGSLLVKQSTSTATFIDGANEVTSTILSSVDGKTTTSARVDIDSFVLKSDPKYYTVPGPTTFWDTGRIQSAGASSQLNQVIKADQSTLNGQLLTSGFFFIEVDAILTNELISETETTQHICGIIDRYNSKGSYTSSAADGTMIYNHTGETTILSSVKVRILNSDRTPAITGIDNTIFLEVIRGQGQPPPPQEAK